MKILLSAIFVTQLFVGSFGQEKLLVLTSASMFQDMASQIGGDKITSISIVPVGGDPHLYSPKPSDTKKVLNADLILINGLTFEGWILKLIKNSETEAKIVTLTEGIEPISSPDYKNSYDPHAWMSAKNGLTYIDNIYTSLVELDPENKDYYSKNYIRYKSEVEELDSYIRIEIQTIPPENRVIITHHDAFAYFGLEYGFKLIALKGISTEEKTQTSDIFRISKAIKEHNVAAIFIESTINPKMIQRISKDNKVKIGGELYSDSLSPKGKGADTYTKMLKQNTDVIVKALSSTPPEEKNSLVEPASKYSWIYLIGLAVLILLFFLIIKYLRF